MKKIKFKRKQIALLLTLSILFVLIILLATKTNLLNHNKLARNEYNVTINTTSIDISNVITNTPNIPMLGAGMIPIKWNETENVWEITTKDDVNWYDYSKGKLANVMLSNGYYKSELEVGMDPDKQLASKNVGVGVPDDPQKMGTIFTWVPRLMYKEDKVEYLKDTCIVEYDWTTPSCFAYYKLGANEYDLAFTGMWVSNKTTEHINNAEDNKYGLIKNEIVSEISAEELTVVEKLNGKLGNNTELTNANPIQTIKILKTNTYLPISTKHEMSADTITLKTIYKQNDIKYVLDENGNILSNDISGNASRNIDDEIDEYIFYVIDTKGNIKKHRVMTKPGKPDLTGFNINTTFFVTYDEAGNETNVVPIGEKKPQDWYGYENQKWANIVVKNEENEAYFVWIPRYMYKLNQETQRSDVKFVDLDNNYTDIETGKVYNPSSQGYTLPEAFTWNGTQIKGYWMSKYELGATSSYKPEIKGGSGVIRVKNIIANVGSSYTYEMYLIKDGKRVVYDAEAGQYIEGTTPITLTNNNYTFTNLEQGKYAVNIIVKNSDGAHIKSLCKEVDVLEAAKLEAPDLTGFNKDTTFFVTYDEAGNEINTVPIGEEIPKNWYDYDNQKWANIVTRNNDNEAYFVWIPRYEYKLDSANQRSNVIFIPKDKTVPDEGYTIPEAFTWNGTELGGYWMSKYELGATSTYKPEIQGGSGIIRVKNIIAKVGADYTYEMYLIKDGKRIGSHSETGEIIPIELTTNNYTFTNLEQGKYTVNIIVKNSEGKHIKSICNQVEVLAPTKLETPDLTGFNKDTTFYVTYDEEGNETSSIPISQAPPSNWYDYDNQKWANIVTRNNGKEAYFVWIPRYEYKLDSANQRSNVIFIPKDKTTPDAGYTIPEAFTWNGTEIGGYWMSKYELGT